MPIKIENVKKIIEKIDSIQINEPRFAFVNTPFGGLEWKNKKWHGNQLAFNWLKKNKIL